MNLFIAKWGPLSASADELAAALQADALYGQLADGYRTRAWDSPCSTLAFACAHEGDERARPRRYVHEDTGAITVFDGLPVDSRRRYKAHVASELAHNWERFDADVDGFYAALRITKNPLRLEAQSDLFAVYKLFRWTDGESWLLGNSVEAIDQLISGLAIDIRTTGLFLSLTLVPGDHTLLDGVRCLGPARRMIWSDGAGEPRIRRTVELRDLLHYPPRKVADEMIDDLAARLLATLDSIGSDFPNVLCPLTGGKDSRLLAALLHRAGVPSRSYTYGNALGTDAQIASQVAGLLGIEHENILTATDDLRTEWDGLSADFVRRGSGMSPVQLITGLVTAKLVDMPNKPVRLWGAGSSICRAPYFSPLDYVRKADLETVRRRLVRLIVKDYRGLLRPDTVAAGRRYISDELDRYDGAGVRPLDLPDVLWIHERGAARSGKNMRTTMDCRDTYSPFFAHSFATASFALSALQRATEPLHYRLLKKTFPAIHDIPFDKGGWQAQNQHLNLLTEVAKVLSARSKLLIDKRIRRAYPDSPQHMIVRDTMFERVRWLRFLAPGMRERLTDSGNADLWDLVDKQRFMKITSDGVADAELAFHAVALFTIDTVLTYRSERRSRRCNAA